ncbi:hypothetical protein B0H10DRAFT_2214720 [Mycena sp. CBHHK59/15]|nr:hypothetical protein B0H10DRAFT_2214720 [Mycena sp. CBHHK59/15]
MATELGAGSKHTPVDRIPCQPVSTTADGIPELVFSPTSIALNATKFLDHEWVDMGVLLVSVPRPSTDVKMRALHEGGREVFELLSDSEPGTDDRDSDLEVMEALQCTYRSSSAIPLHDPRAPGDANGLQSTRMSQAGHKKEKTNYWKYLKRARKQADEYKNLFDLLSNNEVPGLSRLLSNAKREGWSPSKTSEKTKLAIKGEYHTRNYTEFDVDLAILIYELGGGAALQALNKAPIRLPSRHTIADVCRKLSLRITISDVKVSDILENIKKGSWQSSAQLLQKLIQAWKLSPFGEAKHGPLWSIASDGDATRRAALYLICMHRQLGPDDPLYEFLSELGGLNLYTGEGGLTMDFD